MKYVFFGTPQFAAIVLEKLISAGLPPVALVCNPDRPVGRKKIITPPPTKLLVTRHQSLGIKVLQPENLSDLMSNVSALMSDLFVVTAYNKILPGEVIEMPQLGTIGIHPSLLPKYRGPSPIQSAILAGEKGTGVTLYLLTEKMDDGPILAQKKVPIELFAYSRELERCLAEAGAELLIKTLPKLTEGKITPVPQDESLATYTKKFTAEDAFVTEEDLKAAQAGSAKTPEIYNKIRALNPEPGAWTIQNGKRVKLLEAKIIDSRLQLTKIQQEGKTPSAL